jgi:O-antigen/teichoic acid export membrane protein
MAWQAIVSSGGLIAHGWVGWSLLRFEKLFSIWDRKKAIAIAHYSAMTWFTSIGSALFSQGDRLIVGSILDSKLLGVYAAITNITSQINSLSALAIQPLLPSLSSQLGKLNVDRDRLERQIKIATKVNGIVALGLGALLSIFAPLVLSAMIPEGVTNEYLLGFRLATVIYSLYSVNAVGHYILFSVNAVNISLTIALVSGIVSLIMIFFGSNYFGLLGAIAGNSGYLGVWFLNFIGMKKIGIATKKWIELLYLLILGFLTIAFISWSIKYESNCHCLSISLSS